MALKCRDGLYIFEPHLVTCIKKGLNTEAQQYFDQGENLAYLTDQMGATLLHICARYGNSFMADYCIRRGFRVNAKDKCGVTPLELALDGTHEDVVELLLDSKAEIYALEPRECLLNKAFRYIMKLRKSDPSLSTTPLFRLFAERVCNDYKADKETITKKLLEACVSLPLVVMVVRDAELTELFLDNGHDVNETQPQTFCTALHLAVENNDFPNVSLLLERGAYVNAIDIHYRIPVNYYNCATRDIVTKIQILKCLIDAGATLTRPTFENCSALETLLSKGGYPTVRTVFQSNISLNSRFREDHTPLHFLASNQCPNVMSFINGQSFDVNAREKEAGNTPLMYAITKGKNVSSVEVLIDNGADVDVVNYSGETPLHVAVVGTTYKRKAVFMTICKVLLLNGVNIQYDVEHPSKKIPQKKSIFNVILQFKAFDVAKMIITQLVVNEDRGEPIRECIMEMIESNEIFRDHYKLCKELMEQMKVTRINDSLTLYELLTGREADLAVHLRDPKFFIKLEEYFSTIFEESSHFIDVLKNRVRKIAKALQLIESEAQMVAIETRCSVM